jgi:hypothetical protein
VTRSKCHAVGTEAEVFSIVGAVSGRVAFTVHGCKNPVVVIVLATVVGELELAAVSCL